MILHGYHRSSAAYRVRIVLALKGLAFDQRNWNLLLGEQKSDALGALSPLRLLPVLEDGPASLTQSLAIIEYLDETHPEPALHPPGAAERARGRAIGLTIACEVHPLNNLRVLDRLASAFGASPQARDDWKRHWMIEGLAAAERLIEGADAERGGIGGGGPYCCGALPGFADVCLIPQLYNARRLDLDLRPFPRILRADEACAAHPAFAAAHPDRQPDAAPARA